MKAERWQQISSLFESAITCDVGERAVFLDQACEGDERLRREVESLIAAHEKAGDFVAGSALEVAAKMVASQTVVSAVGTSLGHFKIVDTLGSGGMGTVYLAEDTRLGRKAALKLLPEEFMEDENRVRRFEREARAASALNHPNIVTIYEIGKVEEKHFIATEYIEGQTLRDHLANRQLKLSEILDIVIQVTSALVAAHEAGVTHRDIKPENIMLRRDGYVKVVDFGLAKLTEQPSLNGKHAQMHMSLDTIPGMVMGTLHYMSPEQARGLFIDPRSDIWTVGVILYEMITGTRPFDGSTSSDVLAAVLEKHPPRVTSYYPEVPVQLEKIVCKALAKDREERYQVAKELQLDLKSLKQELELDAKLANLRNPSLHSETDSIHTKPLTVETLIKTTTDTGEEVSALSPSSTEYETSPDASRRRLVPASQPWTQRRRRWIGVAALILIAGSVGFHFWPEVAPPLSRAVPLTSYPDFELNPALSPDGNHVAFTWTGETQDNYDIYIKLIGSGSAVRLTNNPVEDLSPAWSPEGSTLAFLRRFPDDRNEVLLIPAFGVSERKLAEVRIQTRNDRRLRSLAWSPDGKWLAVSHRESEDDAEGLFLISARTGEKRRLTKPPRDYYGDFTPAFSPNGSTLAFSRLAGPSASEVYLLSLSESPGEARRLTHHDLWAADPVWTPDGRYILYVFAPTTTGSSELRKISASGSGSSEQVPLLEENIRELSFGHHLVYSRRSQDTNIWRSAVPAAGAPPAVPQLLLSSTHDDFLPHYSPDGKRIAFGSSRSGTGELWVADADGLNPVRLTSFGGPMVGFMNWSPNSQHLVFHARPKGQADLFTISAAGGVPKQLTMDPSDDTLPSYSSDGRWIYFSSKRSGQYEIWKIPAQGGAATRITQSGDARMPLESPDGSAIYYIHDTRAEDNGVWRVPVRGGYAEQVTGPLSKELGFAITKEGVFYPAPPVSRSQYMIRFLSFSTGRSWPVVVMDRPIDLGLSLSPDQRFLIFAHKDQTGSDLMVIENFVLR